MQPGGRPSRSGGARFRCVRTSLLGYGGTTERSTGGMADIFKKAEIVESVIRRAASPVHLVGHSFGGLVALAVALRSQVPLLSLAILEAPAVELMWHVGDHPHNDAFRAMTDSYFAAARAGKQTAVETMIDFYGGFGTFAGWPERVRRYAIETAAVSILDRACAYGFRLTPASLAHIDVPTLVLRGAMSHPAVKRANERVSQCINRGSLVTVAGSAHFMISTHASAVAGATARHVARTEYFRTGHMASPAAGARR